MAKGGLCKNAVKYEDYFNTIFTLSNPSCSAVISNTEQIPIFASPTAIKSDIRFLSLYSCVSVPLLGEKESHLLQHDKPGVSCNEYMKLQSVPHSKLGPSSL